MRLFALLILAVTGLFGSQNALSSCRKPAPDPGGNDTIVPPPVTPFDINSITDDYTSIASSDLYYAWGSHNVHDPCIIKDGDYYYCYNTDVAYGTSVRPGIQVRRSKDLIEWQFYGWVFSDVPQPAADYIRQHGGTPNKGLWAPYVLKAGNEFRLYYSLSSTPKPRLSTIGLATAPTPAGPWTHRGLVVSSTDDNTVQTNAIDPTVITDAETGKQWLYYGSAWDGIYLLELNPATGLPMTGGSRGRRVSQRGFSGNTPNGNIEGAEILYQPELDKYYLFIAYDWLHTKYNVRVARADSPEGPFLDFNGHDINLEEDHGPMILAPYQFSGHSGYQGVAHCGVIRDGNNYYMLHQARPVFNSYLMNLHVRQIFWNSDGWPLVSPERFAGEKNGEITKTEMEGNWERIELKYQVVPGYQNEQINPDLQSGSSMLLSPDGTISGAITGHWTYNSSLLNIVHPDGNSEKLMVSRGRDWENKKECLVFTGMNENGLVIWGKKQD